MKIGSIADAAFAAERRCDTMWIPEGVALVVFALLALCGVASIEALIAHRNLMIQRRAEERASPQELVIMSTPNAQLYAGTSLAVGFAALVMTTQTVAVAILIRFGTTESVVWTMIASSGVLWRLWDLPLLHCALPKPVGSVLLERENLCVQQAFHCTRHRFVGCWLCLLMCLPSQSAFYGRQWWGVRSWMPLRSLLSR